MKPVDPAEVKSAVAAAGGKLSEKTVFGLAGRRLFVKIGGEWHEADEEGTDGQAQG